MVIFLTQCLLVSHQNANSHRNLHANYYEIANAYVIENAQKIVKLISVTEKKAEKY